MEKITYGIRNVYVSEVSVSEAGAVTYGTPTALPGATEIALPPVGDAVKKYADNVVYVKMNVNQGYDGTLSIFNIPDWFARDYLGMTLDSNGVLVENSTGTKKDFALIFEFITDTAKTKRNVLYNCTAGRADIASATTEEGADPQPFSVPIVAAPAYDNQNVKASIVGDSNDATWSGWLSSVYTPAAATQYQVAVTVTKTAVAQVDALVVCGGKFAKTDALGKAYFMLPNGTYDVMVSATGCTAMVSTVTVSSANTTKAMAMS